MFSATLLMCSGVFSTNGPSLKIWIQTVYWTMLTQSVKTKVFTHCFTNKTLLTFKHTMYQHKVEVDMLNAVKSVLDDISRISPSSEQVFVFTLTKR